MNDFEDRLHARMQDLRAAIDPPPSLWAKVEQRTPDRCWVTPVMIAVAAAVVLFAAIAGVSGGGGGSSNKDLVAAGPPATDTSTSESPGTGVEAPPTTQAPTTSTTGTGDGLKTPNVFVEALSASAWIFWQPAGCGLPWLSRISLTASDWITSG